MEKQLLLAAYLVGGMLLGGCSSKPDVGDVEDVLKEAWKPCKLVKASSFKKTNGVDHGDNYEMAISFKLELVRDIAEEDLNTTWLSATENCPGPIGMGFAKLFISPPYPLKKGKTVEVYPVYTMIKSEKGWIIN